MEYTQENIEKLANLMISKMSKPELKTYVFEDLYSIMSDDEELFQLNAEEYNVS